MVSLCSTLTPPGSPGISRLRPIPKQMLRLDPQHIDRPWRPSVRYSPFLESSQRVELSLEDANSLLMEDDNSLLSSSLIQSPQRIDLSLQDARHLLSTTKGTQAKSEKLWGSYEKTIRFLREENRLLKNTVDEQHREKADLTRRLDQVSAAERESQIRIRHSAEIEKHNEQVIKELKSALHHDRLEREKGSKEEGGEDKEVYRRKAEYFERELKECLLEVECLRAGLRALEGQAPMATSEQDDEHMTLRAQLTSAEKELRGLRQELQDRRSGSDERESSEQPRLAPVLC